MNQSDDFDFPTGDRIERRARREAERRSPDFSEHLHARIMRAVESSHRFKSLDPDRNNLVPRPGNDSAPRTGVAAAALIVAVVALVILNRAHFEQPRPTGASVLVSVSGPNDVTALPAVEVIQTVPVRVRSAVATVMAEEQFAGLDHDARRMTRYLVDQVPLQDQWNKP